jgi:hypothetical protein
MLKLKFQIVLIAILIGSCIAFVSCDKAKQMVDPVMPMVEETPEPPPMVETPEPPPIVETPEPPPMVSVPSSPITISEIMYGSEIRFSPKQWIEISNTGTETVDLTGWKLTIQNVDSDDLLGPVTATINFRDATFDDAPRIWPNDTLMIVTSATDDNSGGFMEDQVYDLRWREDLGIGFNTTWLSAEGFRITLTDADGSLVDEAGNYDGTMTLWDLPYDFNRGRTRAGNRTSLIRRYANGVALDGTLEESWVSAADANLTADQKTYYGDENDISSPGILGPDTGQ